MKSAFDVEDMNVFQRFIFYIVLAALIAVVATIVSVCLIVFSVMDWFKKVKAYVRKNNDLS